MSNNLNLGELFVNKKINNVLMGFITDSCRNCAQESWQTSLQGRCQARALGKEELKQHQHAGGTHFWKAEQTA